MILRILKNNMMKFVLLVALISQPLTSYAFNKDAKTLLMIEVMGSANLVGKAKKLGYNVIILTANQDQRRVAPETLAQADAAYTVDTNNTQAVIDIAKDISSKQKVDAVIPGNEYFVVQSALVAKELGLKSISPQAAENARNKDYTVIAMEAKGVPTPRFAVVDKPSQIAEHADHVKFPAILKPVDSAASDKVFKVKSVAEAQRKLKEITEGDDEFEMWSYPMRGQALFEEYVPGQEYSIEGIAVGDKATIYSITTKETEDFVEVRHIVGKLADDETTKKIKSYVLDAVKALGIEDSPFHMEVRLNAEGNPLIMEIGTRIAGDHITDVTDLSMDTNYARDYFRMLTDPKCKLETPTNKRFAAIQFFYESGIKKISQFDGLDKLEGKDWVSEVAAYRKVGDTIPEKPLFLKRIGHVMFTGDSLEDIERKSAIIKKTVHIK